MAVVIAIGMPENASERRGIQLLAARLPSDFTLYHNLELPTVGGLPYEYDQIIVGPGAVYVIEVKGYQGEIRGNAAEWRLDSGNVVKSPLPLLNKKAKILAERLHKVSVLLKNVWVQPLIVLTDDHVRVFLRDEQADRVLHLNEAVEYMTDARRLPVSTGSIAHLGSIIGDALMEHLRPLQRAQEIGDYRIIETVGKNNLYTTLLAEHKLVRGAGRVLLKVYHLDIYASAAERARQSEWIRRDAEALQRLREHANIGRAQLPFLYQDRQLVLPVEWVDGQSLRSLLVEGEPLAYARKIDIMRQVCEGLHFAHQHNVVHRDIRPENIIVPGTGPIKLVNFDCSRIMTGDLPSIATRIGRQWDERYVAPEVWLDASQASPQSDLYAVGVVLYEILTGQHPHERIGRQKFSVNNRLTPPTQLNPTLPRDVDEVVANLCATLPKDRYQDAAQAAADLEILV